MPGYITVDIKVSSDDSDRKCSDYSVKENPIKERNFWVSDFERYLKCC